MYLLYNSDARAPLATMPSTLFSHSDCIARVTLSNVVEPILTTRIVPSASVESRFASAENSSGGVSKMAHVNTLGNSSNSILACRVLSSSSGFLTGDPAGSTYKFIPDTRRSAPESGTSPIR